MHIALGRSTNAFMIADPLAVLDEGEIHLGFSGVFRDARSAFSDSMLHDIDVLVARNPAHLPSDIQKVGFPILPWNHLSLDIRLGPCRFQTRASNLQGCRNFFHEG